MIPPTFLQLDQILRLHQSLIDHYGGMDGVRDTGLLESAIAQPQAGFGGEYLHGDIFMKAAAYMFHLVQNHPFLDGNKRIGAASAIVFLAVNDVQIDNDEDGLIALTLSVATGQLGKDEIADWFRQHQL
jgi:death-on-curing protein